MKISTKGRYALTIMLSIAKGYDKDEYISLNKIAEDEQISVKYLEKIMTSLKKNNLVKSTTGKDGGYKLNKKPEEYKIGEIIRAAEENLDVVKCINNPDCPKKMTCKTYPLWEGLNNEINDYLDSKTLKDYL